MTTDEQDLIKQTIAERTSEVIRRRILTLTPGYQPGDRLYPLKLAEDLGVSSTPVREALRLLVSERLVEFSPRRGMTVVQLSADDLDDLVAVRAGLEAMAIRFKGGRITAEEGILLERCLDECEQAIDQSDIAMWRRKDSEFHQLLVAMSKSPRLVSLYESLLYQADIMVVYNPRHADTLREALAEHRELIRQLTKGDASRSEEALRKHWERSRERLHRKYDDFIQGDGRELSPDGQPALSADHRATRRAARSA